MVRHPTRVLLQQSRNWLARVWRQLPLRLVCKKSREILFLINKLDKVVIHINNMIFTECHCCRFSHALVARCQVCDAQEDLSISWRRLDTWVWLRWINLPVVSPTRNLGLPWPSSISESASPSPQFPPSRPFRTPPPIPSCRFYKWSLIAIVRSTRWTSNPIHPLVGKQPFRFQETANQERNPPVRKKVRSLKIQGFALLKVSFFFQDLYLSYKRT